MRRLLFIAYFLEVGLLLVVIPWSSYWERNYFTEVLPALRPVVLNHFLRGAITGLGIVNLWAGLAELASLAAARGRPLCLRSGPSSLSLSEFDARHAVATEERRLGADNRRQAR